MAPKKRQTKRIPLEVSPSVYDEIKAFADSRGESVNAFLRRAAQEAMEREDVQEVEQLEPLPPNVKINIPPSVLQLLEVIDRTIYTPVYRSIEKSIQEQAEIDKTSPPSIPATAPKSFDTGEMREIHGKHYNMAVKAAEATGETVDQFIIRAIYSHVERIKEQYETE